MSIHLLLSLVFSLHYFSVYSNFATQPKKVLIDALQGKIEAIYIYNLQVINDDDRYVKTFIEFCIKKNIKVTVAEIQNNTTTELLEYI